MQSVGQQIVGAVREGILGFAPNDAGVEEVREVAIEGNSAEADDDADAGQGLNLAGQVSSAIADLLRQGLVSRWSTADDGGDPGVAQLEAIVAMDGARLGGKAKLMQDGIHESAGAVPGEGASGSVGSMSAGGQTENQDAGARVAEAWNRTRPIGLIEVGAAFGLCDA